MKAKVRHRRRDSIGRAEIFGETESAEYVYQVVEGAVRSYKLLSDGRSDVNDMDRAYEKLKLYAAGGIRVAFAA